MEVDKDMTWRQNKIIGSWFLCYNNNDKKILEKGRADQNEQIKNKKFFISKQRQHGKGQIVYTKAGYGIIQKETNKEGIVVVKIDNQLKEFKECEVLLNIPLKITLIRNKVQLKLSTNIATNSTSQDLISHFEKQFKEGEESQPPTIYFKGKKLIDNQVKLLDLGIVPNSKLLAMFVHGEPRIMMRFKKTNKGWGYGGSKDSICFKVSKSIAISGCGIYNATNITQTQLHGTVKLLESSETDKGQQMAEIYVECKHDLSYFEGKIHKCYFKKPVRIKPETFYIIQSALKGQNSYYGSQGIKTFDEKGIIFTFKSAKGQNNGTGITSGQFPQIMYFA